MKLKMEIKMKSKKINSNKSNKKFLPYISLRIFNKDGKMIRKVGSHKTKRVFCFIQRGDFKNFIFKVSVQYDKESLNEGEYQNKKDLIFNLKEFLKG